MCFYLRLGRVGIAVFLCTLSFGALAEEIQNVASSTKSGTFEAAGKPISLNGLVLTLAENYSGAAAPKAEVTCIRQEDTPELAISAKTYGAGAQLINVSGKQSEKCASYDIKVIQSPETPPGKIIVSMNYSPEAVALNGGAEPKVFIFNSVHGNWAEAKAFLPTQKQPNKIYATLTEHHQKIIGGVITVPEPLTSEPAKIGPSLISKSLENVSPTSGLLSIKGIEPNSKGEFSLSLPMMLRPNRGPGPSFSVDYRPGVDGVLGKGWDLSVSSITIRGSAPIYHPKFETEDYQLDGQDLIALDAGGKDIPPLYKGGPILARNTEGPRVFRLRNNSQGLIIRRYGEDPNTYHWEVWDPKSKVTKLYGGSFSKTKSIPEINHDSVVRGTVFTNITQESVIGQWGLSAEYDNQIARNGAAYEYEIRECKFFKEQRCTHALRLKEIRYNVAFGDQTIDPRGVTFVNFDWAVRDEKRVISDGRLGFLRANDYWLKKITVSYQSDYSSHKIDRPKVWLSAAPNEPSQIYPGVKDDGEEQLRFIYAVHEFEMNDGKNDCLNFDRFLETYKVTANPAYDINAGDSELRTQSFHLGYRGESDSEEDANCGRAWKSGTQDAKNSEGSAAVAASILFPTHILANNGFNRLVANSPLGEQTAQEIGGSFQVGVGPPGDTKTKEFTVGLKIGTNFSRSETSATMVDVTGDGLQDKVTLTSGGLRYCAAERGTVAPYKMSFPLSRCGRIVGINEIAISNSRTNSVSLEATTAPSVYVGVGFSKSVNRTYVYFSHRDADGLIDLVSYGRVFYSLGETCADLPNGTQVCSVTFSPNNPLTPPIPGHSQKETTKRRVPEDLLMTIRDIEATLVDLTDQIEKLAFIQKTIAWEAPLDGNVVAFGQVKMLEPSDLTPLATVEEWGVEVTPASFAVTRSEVGEYADIRTTRQTNVVTPKCGDTLKIYECDAKSAKLNGDIDFVEIPGAKFDLRLSRRGGIDSLLCNEGNLDDIGAADQLSQREISSVCRNQSTNHNEIAVRRGDVIYFTYTVHPHMSQQVVPHLEFRYSELIANQTFNGDDGTSGVPNTLQVFNQLAVTSETIICGPSNHRGLCIIPTGEQFAYSIKTGLIPSQENATVRLPESESLVPRRLKGILKWPRELAENFDLSLVVRGVVQARQADKDVEAATPAGGIPVPASAMPEIFSIKLTCQGGSETCKFDLSNVCTIDRTICGNSKIVNPAATISAELNVRFAGEPNAPLVRGINDRLAEVSWSEPPRILTRFDGNAEEFIKDPEIGDGTAGVTLKQSNVDVITYIPVQIGDPDFEYHRVETGIFVNRLADMALETDESSTARMQDRLSREFRTVELARERQMAALCDFRQQILVNYDNEANVFIPRTRMEQYRSDYEPQILRELKANSSCSDDFVADQESSSSTSDILLDDLLRQLSHKDHMTSLLTLLKRVDANLENGTASLIDVPDLSRRGYRLPSKPNPIDCLWFDGLKSGEESQLPRSAITGKESECSYRISSNFALEVAQSDAQPFQTALRTAFQNREAAAFNVVLTAIIDDRPLSFRQVFDEVSTPEDGSKGSSAASSGTNSGEDFDSPNADVATCANVYGTIGTNLHLRFPREDNGNEIFMTERANSRLARAVAFSDEPTLIGVRGRNTPNFPTYTDRTIELKQDCRDYVDQNGSVLRAERTLRSQNQYSITYTIREDGRFIGRDDIFEFKARPGDVVHFSYEIKPVLNSVRVSDGAALEPGDQADRIDGHFSVVEFLPAAQDDENPIVSICNPSNDGPNLCPPLINRADVVPGVYLIPRSPKQLFANDLPTCNLLVLEEGEEEDPPQPSQSGCAPWGKLGWAEMFLGAQYRTYSDAQPQADGTFSLLRRRDFLRLRPEFSVRGNRFDFIEDPKAQLPELRSIFQNELVTAQFVKLVQPSTSDKFAIKNSSSLQFQAAEKYYTEPQVKPQVNRAFLFFERDPLVFKTGRDWTFFAGKTDKGGALRGPLEFVNLRFDNNLKVRGPIVSDLNQAFATAKTACGLVSQINGPGSRINIAGCESVFSPDSENSVVSDLSRLTVHDGFFALRHRFVGPTVEVINAKGEGVPQLLQGENALPENPCAAMTPSGYASCWQAEDRSVFYQRIISNEENPELTSAAGLLGLEVAPIAQFLFEFDALKKIACLAPVSQDFKLCEAAKKIDSTGGNSANNGTSAGQSTVRYPNRQRAPPAKSTWQVFAPVLSSSSKSVSLSAGALTSSVNSGRAETKTTTLFQDVNGDGYPEVIRNGKAEMSSPVGISRRDWWKLFQADGDTGKTLRADMAAQVGFNEHSESRNGGAGFGLSAETAALFKPKGTDSRTSNSTDANVTPSISLSFDSGNDEEFTQLMDLNGDGLADGLTATKVGSDLSLAIGVGNRLLENPSNILFAPDSNSLPDGLQGTAFNSNHSAGFGLRLGFSAMAGSFRVGMGMDNRTSGSTAALIDFTGNGRPDIVVPNAKDGCSLKVFPNLGNGFGNARCHKINGWTGTGTGHSETTIIDAGPTITAGVSAIVKVTFTAAGKLARNKTRVIQRIADINSDGVPDIVSVAGAFNGVSGLLAQSGVDEASVSLNVHYNPEAEYHRLSQITTPSGTAYTIKYDLKGNQDPAHGRAAWVVSSVMRDDKFEPADVKVDEGQTLPKDGDDVVLTSYEFEDGIFNRAEGSFYGFEKQTTTVCGADMAVSNEALLSCPGNRFAAPVPKKSPRPLVQTVRSFSNRDFFSQGSVLKETQFGWISGADPVQSTSYGPAKISEIRYAYSIDNLRSLSMDNLQSLVSATWSKESFKIGGSIIPTNWEMVSPSLENGHVLDFQQSVEADAESLDNEMETNGSAKEISSFWAQQTAALRLRFVHQQTFSGDPKDTTGTALHSAVVFDHDQWGNVLRFTDIGELTSDLSPVEESSVTANIGYKIVQALNSSGPGVKDEKPIIAESGRPIVGLAINTKMEEGTGNTKMEEGTGVSTDAKFLRAREAIYTADGRGNLHEMCIYSGGEGPGEEGDKNSFNFKVGMCESYGNSVDKKLSTGSYLIAGAVKETYKEIDGLPNGLNRHNAIQRHRVTGYDQFGNVTSTISPFSESYEWIERQFDYRNDPFRTTPTKTELTRCAMAAAGIGTNSANISEDVTRCNLPTSYNANDKRIPVVHASSMRPDLHHGVIGQTTDINDNTIYFDYDRWGRLGFVAQAWERVYGEEDRYQARITKALEKLPTDFGAPDANNIGLLAVADYAVDADGDANFIHKSMVTRFDSDAMNYAGLLRRTHKARRTVAFADSLGQVIQTQSDADICSSLRSDILENKTDFHDKTELSDFCPQGNASKTRVLPAPQRDALGRELVSFESYAGSGGKVAYEIPDPIKVGQPDQSPIGDWSSINLIGVPIPDFADDGLHVFADDGIFEIADDGIFGQDNPRPVSKSTYDGAGRLLLRRSRLAGNDENKIWGTEQNQYRIISPSKSGDDRLTGEGNRFEAITVNPRCAASAVWSDGRGLVRAVIEEQTTLFTFDGPLKRTPVKLGEVNNYSRNRNLTRPNCKSVADVGKKLAATVKSDPQIPKRFAARVTYGYDALKQLIGVDYPLEIGNPELGRINITYDDMGRMTGLNEPDSGCTIYQYDGLNNLTSEIGFRFEAGNKACGSTSQLHNRKVYGYAADRLIAMQYSSLDAGNGQIDQRDNVRFYLDRYPHSADSEDGEKLPQYVPNADANMIFATESSPNCVNCIGQVAVVTDRTGAKSFGYNELGLPIREVRTIVADLKSYERQGSGSETYLPELARYILTRDYSNTGDLTSEEFEEQSDSQQFCTAKPKDGENAANANSSGLCKTEFKIERRYTPDGAIAAINIGNHVSVHTASDALSRPIARWTHEGALTGYRYDTADLRRNEMITLAFARRTIDDDKGIHVPIQNVGYQYDGGGNIDSYVNSVLANDYASNHTFSYDGANRLIGFSAQALSDEKCMISSGTFAYDLGHRFSSRTLGIAPGIAPKGAGARSCTENGTAFTRGWKYNYGLPVSAPIHAPNSIDFTIGGVISGSQQLNFDYDAVGRMKRARSGSNSANAPFPLMSNRRIKWDGAGRIIGVFGGKDALVNNNRNLLREEYVYDYGGNRTLKIHRPVVAGEDDEVQELERVTLYLTPFYSRPLNGRGRIQIAEGNLPTVSVEAQANGKNVEHATYLYSDLPVGSATAAVTYTGDNFSETTLHIARREYSPYGLELTTDALATTPKSPPLSSFHGKELDRVTGFSSFGARSYSRDLGIWLSPDPLLHNFVLKGSYDAVDGRLRMATYGFAGQNPVSMTDPDGNLAFIPILIGASWVAGKAWDAYEGYQTYQRIQSGQQTIAGAARDRGIEFAISTALGIGGKLAFKGIRKARLFGKRLTAAKHSSGISLSKSQKEMIREFDSAGYPKEAVTSPTSHKIVGTKYTLPDNSRARVMQPDGASPRRTSFENSNGGPISPTTGKPVQPPRGLTRAERLQYVRERTHLLQDD